MKGDTTVTGTVTQDPPPVGGQPGGPLIVTEDSELLDDLLRLCGAQTWIGLAALSELEIAGRITVSEGGFYSRS